MSKNKDANVSVKKKRGSWVVWGVVILVMGGLGGYGTAQFTGNLRSVGKVDGTDIMVGRYQRQLAEDVQNLRTQMGFPLTMAQALQFGRGGVALGQVVNEIALENEARRVEISVGDEGVARALAQQSWFYDFNGNFDRDTYRATLRSWGYSVSNYEEEIRAGVGRELLVSGLAQGVSMPASMADLLYTWEAERRSFVWAELSERDLATPVAAPTEDQLTAWHNDHADSYTLPEKRRITYVWITPAMLVPQIVIDEDELRALYDQRRAEFVQPERRLVERLVFGSDDEAAAAMARLTSGEVDFAELVAERGLTLEDVNLDEVTREDLGDAGEVVFALADPGVAGPAPSALGPAIFRVNAILEAQETTFEEASEDLRHDLATNRAQRQIADMFEEVNDLLAGGNSLADVAEETALELGQIDWWPEVSSGIAGYDAFRRAAQGAEPDDFSEAIGLDDGGIFALHLDAVIPPEVQPLEEVRDRVTADWRQDAVATALGAMADELLPRIEAGESPGSFGLQVNHVDEVTRRTALADVPSGLIPKAFELAPGRAARIPGTDGTGTVAIVSTTTVLPPDPDNAALEAARATLIQRTSAQLQSDLVAAFTQSILAGANIRIDETGLNAVNAAMN